MIIVLIPGLIHLNTSLWLRLGNSNYHERKNSYVSLTFEKLIINGYDYSFILIFSKFILKYFGFPSYSPFEYSLSNLIDFNYERS